MTPNVGLSKNLLFRKNTFIIILILNILQNIDLIINRLLDSLTARQYGEVVLPDEASGQSPGSLAKSSHGARRGSLPRSSAANAGAHFLPADSYRHGYKIC